MSHNHLKNDNNDGDDLRRIIRAAIGEVMSEAEVESRPRYSAPEVKASIPKTQSRKPLPGPSSLSAIDKIKRSTPARLVQGRTGTRYLTDNYLALRADHAIALDAVHSELPEGYADEQGWLYVESQCTSHEEFLLHPNHGRRLSDESKARLEAEGDKGMDIQIIAGDGLAASALMLNGKELVSALQKTLEAEGFSLGKPILAKFARVGLQDDVGVVLGAKSTIIIVGERPGLGTGDSLSIYTAVGPRLDQDNSEKDCISNVRPMGFLPDAAAGLCAKLMRRSFDAGGGGMKLL